MQKLLDGSSRPLLWCPFCGTRNHGGRCEQGHTLPLRSSQAAMLLCYQEAAFRGWMMAVQRTHINTLFEETPNAKV